MRTLDEQGTTRGSIPARVRQDIALIRRLAGMILSHFTVGARIRREYRAKETAGEIYWVDE
jgi:hypothetical protein